MDGRSGAIEGRVVILKTRRHTNHCRLNISYQPYELTLVVAISGEAIEGANASDGQRGRPAQPCSRWCFTSGREMDAGFWLEEMNQLRDQFETFFTRQIINGRKPGFESH